MRPTQRTLAALLAVLAVTVGGVGCGSDGGGAGSGSGEAKALLERAFEKQVKSGELELELKADVGGVRSLDDPLRLTLGGPFKSGGEGQLPQVDWNVSFDGGGTRLSGGVIATQKNAYLAIQGRAFELGEDVYARLGSGLGERQPDRPLSLGAFGVDLVSWLKDPKVEDGDPIGGDATRKVTGSVDVRKAVKDVVDLIRSPAVRKELDRRAGAAAAVPEWTDKDLDQVEDAIKGIDAELNVDRDDVLRRFFAEVDLDAQENGDGKDVRGKLSFSYVLRKVGGDPVIRAPANARRLEDLLGGLGALGGLGGRTLR